MHVEVPVSGAVCACMPVGNGARRPKGGRRHTSALLFRHSWGRRTHGERLNMDQMCVPTRL
eukprot:1147280-Pelagomonas_calceolata.AAC.6